MPSKKLIYLGTKEIGADCFEILCQQRHIYNFEITAVFTNQRQLGISNQSVEKLANQFGIPVFNDIKELLNLPTVDIFISVQYHQILKKEHLAKAKYAFNFHMAPLPEYRGCNQFSFAIIDNQTRFGTTLHLMNEGIDNGDIVDEIRFDIPQNCFVNELYQTTYLHTIDLFKKSLPKIIKLDFTATPQQNLMPLRDCRIHYRNEIEQIKIIHDNWPLEKQLRYFRATFFPPFPPAVLMDKNGNTQKLSLDWYKNQIKKIQLQGQ